MKDQFKKMHQDKQLPEEKKEEILDELYSLQMMAEILELFTAQFLETEFNIFDIENDLEDAPDSATNEEENFLDE